MGGRMTASFLASSLWPPFRKKNAPAPPPSRTTARMMNNSFLLLGGASPSSPSSPSRISSSSAMAHPHVAPGARSAMGVATDVPCLSCDGDHEKRVVGDGFPAPLPSPQSGEGSLETVLY